MKHEKPSHALFERPHDVADYESQVDLADRTRSYYWLARFAANAESALEIGCSTGFFSQHLAGQGCRVTGVELNESAAAQARSSCTRVICGDIENEKTRAQVSEQFDVVIMGDVLEHLQRPDLLLMHTRREWLKRKGRVVLSVPNSGHWLFRREISRGRFPYRHYGLFDLTHLRFFTRDSLFDLIANTGYHLEEVGFTVNPNAGDDFTFAIATSLYRHRPDFRRWMNNIERRLATIVPTLFAYQFVCKISPQQ